MVMFIVQHNQLIRARRAHDYVTHVKRFDSRELGHRSHIPDGLVGGDIHRLAVLPEGSVVLDALLVLGGTLERFLPRLLQALLLLVGLKPPRMCCVQLRAHQRFDSHIVTRCRACCVCHLMLWLASDKEHVMHTPPRHRFQDRLSLFVKPSRLEMELSVDHYCSVSWKPSAMLRPLMPRSVGACTIHSLLG